MMDPGVHKSHGESYKPSFYEKRASDPIVSGVYSYNSSVTTGLPTRDTTEGFLRYIPNKAPLSAGQVSIDISEGGNDKDIRVSDISRGDQKLRLRASQDLNSKGLSSVIKPFPKRTYKLINIVTKELKTVLAEKQGWKIFWLLVLNLILTFMLLVYSGSSNSLALQSFAYLTIFDILSLVTCLLSLWVSLQKCTPSFSFGFDRYEVLSVFSSTMLTMFGALFIFKESIERLLMPEEVKTDGLFVLAVSGLLLHLLVTFVAGNKPLTEVSKAATSNWLQDAVSDLGHSICGFAPVLGRILVQKINPIALLGISGAVCVLVTDGSIDYNKSFITDSLCAMVMTFIIWATMLPLSIYSGQILLQTCPQDIMNQIDKCLREASTLDGVLEFRNEHFWTVSFGKMAGSLHVRIRRDANEQMVLAHVTNKLSSHVTYLTVQVFKDDWIRSNSGSKLPSIPPAFPRTPNLPKIPQTQKTMNNYSLSPSSQSHSHYTGKMQSNLTGSPLAASYGTPSKIY